MASQISANTTTDVMLEVNMTPLIDVMLVLIIMLIITIPIQNHSFSLNLPTKHTGEPAKVVHKIEVDFDGVVFWNGATLSEKQLEINLLQAASLGATTEVQIRPHQQVDYKHVARVMAMAQRLGVTKLGVIGNEQFLK